MLILLDAIRTAVSQTGQGLEVVDRPMNRYGYLGAGGVGAPVPEGKSLKECCTAGGPYFRRTATAGVIVFLIRTNHVIIPVTVSGGIRIEAGSLLAIEYRTARRVADDVVGTVIGVTSSVIRVRIITGRPNRPGRSRRGMHDLHGMAT